MLFTTQLRVVFAPQVMLAWMGWLLCSSGVLFWPNYTLVAQDPSASGDSRQFAWRFEPGDQLQVVLNEKTVVRATCNTLVNLNETELTMTMSWHVQSVAEGVAEIVQTVDRIEMLLSTRTDDNTNQVKYDTDNADLPATAPQAAIAQQLKALVGLAVVLKTKASGEIVDVAIDEVSTEKIRQAPSSTVVRDMLTKAGLERWFRQATFVLPETAIAPGHAWQTSKSLEGVLGGRTLGQRFVWRGPETKDNRPVERFVLESELGPAPELSAAEKADRLAGDPQIPPEVKSFAEKGTFDFDPQLGIFVDGSTETQMATLGKFRELEVDTQFSKTTRMQVSRKLAGNE